MTIGRALAILSLLAALSARPVAAGDDTSFAPPAFAPPAPCNWKVALRTTIVEIDRHPERFYGRCVEVRGVWYGAGLVDEASYVRPFSRPWIGIDAPEALQSEAWRRRPVAATVIGRVSDCAELRASLDATAGPGELPMIGGACHSAEHARIWVVSARFHEHVPGTNSR
jgi:hypothetical protein